MPALAQTKPCWVSTMRTPRSARSTSSLSSRISSTSAGSLPSTAASLRASAPGSTEESLRTRPSALETIFCEMTTTSPSSSSARAAISAADAHPLDELGQAEHRHDPQPSLIRGSFPALWMDRATGALISPAPWRCGGRGRGAPPARGSGRSRRRGVEVEAERGQLLDPEGDARPRGRGRRGGRSCPRRRRGRSRRAGSAPGRWCRSRGGRGRCRRSARAAPVSSRSSSRGSSSGQSPGRRTTQVAPSASARAIPASAASTWPPSSGSGTTSAPASAASSCATGSPLTTIVRSIVRASPIASSTSPTIAATRFRRCSPSSPAASRCFAALKRLTGRTAVAFNARGQVGGVVEHDARHPGAAARSLHQGRGGEGRDLGRRRVGVALVDDHAVDQPGVERGDAGGGGRAAERPHEAVGRALDDGAGDVGADRDDRGGGGGDRLAHARHGEDRADADHRVGGADHDRLGDPQRLQHLAARLGALDPLQLDPDHVGLAAVDDQVLLQVAPPGRGQHLGADRRVATSAAPSPRPRGRGRSAPGRRSAARPPR